jgi:hypothetical protein
MPRQNNQVKGSRKISKKNSKLSKKNKSSKKSNELDSSEEMKQLLDFMENDTPTQNLGMFANMQQGQMPQMNMQPNQMQNMNMQPISPSKVDPLMLNDAVPFSREDHAQIMKGLENFSSPNDQKLDLTDNMMMGMPQQMGMPQMAPQMGMPQMAPQMGMPQMAPQMGMPQMGMPQMGMPQMAPEMGIPQMQQPLSPQMLTPQMMGGGNLINSISNFA